MGGAMQKNRGFTLIELMVTIVVLAVIAMMAAPTFIRIVRQNQLMSDTRDFVDLLTETRSEAIFKQRDQILAVNSNVSGVYKTWIPTYITKDSGDASVAFSRLGQSSASGHGQCFVFIHKDDATLKSYVYVQQGGTVVYNKTATSCPA